MIRYKWYKAETSERVSDKIFEVLTTIFKDEFQIQFLNLLSYVTADFDFITLLSTLGMPKGQLISKCLFGVFTSSKTQTKNRLTTMIPQVKLFLLVFWEN